MIWMLLMGLAGTAAAWGLYEAFTDDDDDHEDDHDSGDETPGIDDDDEDDVDDTPEWDWDEDQVVTEDTTLTLDQDDLDTLLTLAETGELPLITLENDATLTLDIEGDTEGYLHLLSYTQGSEDTEDAEGFTSEHTILVWTETEEAPDLQGDNYNGTIYSDAPSDAPLSSTELVGDTGLVLFDIEVLHADSELRSMEFVYGTDPFAVQNAGTVVADESDYETFSPYDNLGYLSDTTYAMDWQSEFLQTGITLTQADLDYLSSAAEMGGEIPYIQSYVSYANIDVEGEVEGYLHVVQTTTYTSDVGDAVLHTDIYLTDSLETPDDFSGLTPLVTLNGGTIEADYIGHWDGEDHYVHHGYTSNFNFDAEDFASVTEAVVSNYV